MDQGHGHYGKIHDVVSARAQHQDGVRAAERRHQGRMPRRTGAFLVSSLVVVAPHASSVMEWNGGFSKTTHSTEGAAQQCALVLGSVCQPGG